MATARVALAEGTGNLGPAIVKALLDAGFQVTILSHSSSNQVDPRARIQVVDYSSKDSLVAALQGHDAFVNTLGVGTIPLEVQLRLVEAAHAAGVQRFIPSELRHQQPQYYQITRIRGQGSQTSEDTKNRYFPVEEAQITQNQLLKWCGKGDQVERVSVNTEALKREAYEAVQQTPPDFRSLATKLIRRAIFGDKCAAAFIAVDNDVLGVPKLSIIELLR